MENPKQKTKKNKIIKLLKKINYYLKKKEKQENIVKQEEVLSMFSEALRILDRNMAELMVDRMKDEIVDLKEQNDELLEEQR